MKNYWGLVLFLLLFAGCHTSKRPVLYSLMEEESPADLSVLQRQYPGASGVYLFYKHDISNDLKPDFTNNAPRWYFFEAHHWREMVLEDQSAEEPWRVMELALASYEKIRAINYKVTGPDGTVSKYRKSDLKKESMHGDSTRYWVAVDGLPAGSIVEAAYEVERGDLYKHLPLSHDVALQLDKPAVSLEFAYTYPWHWAVQVKETGFQTALELTETEDDKAETRTIHYMASQVPAFAQHQFGPYLKEVAPYFHVQVNKMEIGNVLVYERSDAWENVARGYAHYASIDRKTMAHVRDALKGLELAEGASQHAIIEAVLNHVQSDIEVTRRGDVADVAKKQHGNPFAVAAYARALLEEAGVSTAYLVAHAAAGGNFDETFVTKEQLYHPVLKVEDGAFLFPVLANVPLGYIPSAFEKQPALAFTAEGFEGFRTIAQTGALAYNDKNTYEVFVNSDGEARVTAALELGHHTAYQFFELAGGEEDAQSQIYQLLPHEDGQVDELVFQVRRGAWDTPTRIQAEYVLEDCVKQDGSQVVLRSCGLFSALHDGWAEYRLPRRMNSATGEVSEFTNSVTIHYPAAWTLLSEVRELAETVPGGSFVRKVASASGMVDVEQVLTLERQAVQPIAVAGQDVIALPARASLPMLELTTAPVFTAGLTEEIEPGGPWTLVIKTFASIEEAEKEATAYRNELANAGYDINVLVDGTAPGEFRLVLGTFATRSGIESAKETLGSAIPFDAWMLSLKPQMTAVQGKTGPVLH